MELDFLSSIIKGNNNLLMGGLFSTHQIMFAFKVDKMFPDITTIVIVEYQLKKILKVTKGIL